MTTIQIRIDEKTKKSAKKVFDEIGVDMSTAVKLYLRQVALQKGIPFPLVTKNGFTIQEETEILEAAKEARGGKKVTKALTQKEALKHLDLL